MFTASRQGKDVKEGRLRRCELRISSRAIRNARNHSQRVIAMLYCIMLLAIALAIALYCTGSPTPELEYSFVCFYSILYGTSIVCMLVMLVYFERNHNASIEAIQHGKLTANKVLFSMRGEPVSLYLRIGLCGFAIFGIIYTILRAVTVTVDRSAMNRTIPYAIIRTMFFVVQSIFIVRLHRVVILCHVRQFSLILLHLLTVNLCAWIESALQKITNIMEYLETNQFVPDDHITVLTKLAGYCLPAIPEHCAVAFAVIYEMTQRIGQLKQVESHPEMIHSPRKWNGPRDFTYFCLGTGIAMAVLSVTLLLECGIGNIESLRNWIHVVEMIILSLLSLILCIIGLRKANLMKFSLNYTKNKLDDKLLLLTFVLTVNCTVVSIVLCTIYVTSAPTECLLSFRLVALLIELVQVTLQSYYLHDLFYRCCHHEVLQNLKPANGIIVLLAAINFALWMTQSFQAVHSDILLMMNPAKFELDRLYAMRIFVALMHPMVMLFRYHSSVCFAIAFVRIYEDEVTRYESMLRWMRQSTTKVFLRMNGGLIQNAWFNSSKNEPDATRMRRSVSHPGMTTDTSCENELPDVLLVNRLGHKYQIHKRTSQIAFRRHDTQKNLELACIRIAAGEISSKISKLKLNQERRRSLSSSTDDQLTTSPTTTCSDED